MNNIGAIDRILRIVVGVGVLSLIFIGPATWWGLVGLAPLLTGLVGICPAYGLIGVSTCARCRQGWTGRSVS